MRVGDQKALLEIQALLLAQTHAKQAVLIMPTISMKLKTKQKGKDTAVQGLASPRNTFMQGPLRTIRHRKKRRNCAGNEGEDAPSHIHPKQNYSESAKYAHTNSSKAVVLETPATMYPLGFGDVTSLAPLGFRKHI